MSAAQNCVKPMIFLASYVLDVWCDASTQNSVSGRSYITKLLVAGEQGSPNDYSITTRGGGLANYYVLPYIELGEQLSTNR